MSYSLPVDMMKI